MTKCSNKWTYRGHATVEPKTTVKRNVTRVGLGSFNSVCPKWMWAVVLLMVQIGINIPHTHSIHNTHNIQCTQHIHIHHKPMMCTAHTTPYTQHVSHKGFFSHVHSTSTEARICSLESLTDWESREFLSSLPLWETEVWSPRYLHLKPNGSPKPVPTPQTWFTCEAGCKCASGQMWVRKPKDSFQTSCNLCEKAPPSPTRTGKHSFLFLSLRVALLLPLREGGVLTHVKLTHNGRLSFMMLVLGLLKSSSIGY